MHTQCKTPVNFFHEFLGPDIHCPAIGPQTRAVQLFLKTRQKRTSGDPIYRKWKPLCVFFLLADTAGSR
uniref:Uncharacterized protein n=1 Tax=Anguilla anguilla TaxID=7936 RepID=A0A0E9QRQ6_ANGAN